MLRGLVAVVACALVIDASADERPGIPTWRSLEGAPAASRVWGDGQNLYAITPGGALHRSSDRGASWRVVPGVRARGVFGTSPTDVWAVSERGVAHSTDRGATWKLETLAMLGHAAVMEGGWSAGSHVFVVGTDRGSDGVHRAAIVHSRDGGMSWRSELLPVELARIGGVWGSAANDVYAVGSRGAILHSTGDGVWQVRRAPTGTGSLDGVWGSDAASVYAVGTSGAILHRGDRGKTWSPRASGATYALTTIVGAGNEIFVGSNAGPPLRSIDGRAWRPVTAMLARGHVWPSDSDQLYAVTTTGIEYFGAGPSVPVVATVVPPAPRPLSPNYLPPAPPACNPQSDAAKGDDHVATGSHMAALAAFKKSLACKFDVQVAQKAFLAACNAPSAGDAKALYPSLPGGSTLIQRCIAKGVDPRPFNPHPTSLGPLAPLPSAQHFAVELVGMRIDPNRAVIYPFTRDVAAIALRRLGQRAWLEPRLQSLPLPPAVRFGRVTGCSHATSQRVDPRPPGSVIVVEVTCSASCPAGVRVELQAMLWMTGKVATTIQTSTVVSGKCTPSDAPDDVIVQHATTGSHIKALQRLQHVLAVNAAKTGDDLEEADAQLLLEGGDDAAARRRIADRYAQPIDWRGFGWNAP